MRLGWLEGLGGPGVGIGGGCGCERSGIWRAAIGTPPPLSHSLAGKKGSLWRAESVRWALGDETTVAVLFVRGSRARLERKIGGGLDWALLWREAQGSSARSQRPPIFRVGTKRLCDTSGLEALGCLSRVISVGMRALRIYGVKTMAYSVVVVEVVPRLRHAERRHWMHSSRPFSKGTSINDTPRFHDMFLF